MAILAAALGVLGLLFIIKPPYIPLSVLLNIQTKIDPSLFYRRADSSFPATDYTLRLRTAR